MFRILTVIACSGMLVACTGQGEPTTDQSTLPPVSTPAPGSPDASGAAGSSASDECTESFGGVADAGVTSVTELGDLREEVEVTIEACESLDEWIAGAQQVIPDDINPNTAALLLRMNCGSPSMANTPLCRELAAS
jgi:hypothetical protein